MDASTSASETSVPGIQLNNVTFTYPGCEPFLRGCSLELPRGSRCLLIGANGAGKTTLQQLVAGKYMVGKDSVMVLGRSPFHDMQLTCSGQLSYLGTSWRKDVAFAGYGVPLQGDISAGKMIFGVDGVDPARRATLIELLDIDLYQRINTMSDGQRRRVQICMGLLKPYEVLLLDEITVDLDVVGRLDLLAFFKRECEERGATILYATHIFDGLEAWITHAAYMEDGQIIKGGRREDILDLEASASPATVAAASPSSSAVAAAPRKLLFVVEEWLRMERDHRLEKQARDRAAGVPCAAEAVKPSRTPFSMPSKHLAYFH